MINSTYILIFGEIRISKFFSKLKNIYIDHENNVKKNSKNPDNAQVPGPKVFFTNIFTLKNTLIPGCGIVVFILSKCHQTSL